ncbi:hypothetical protein AAF712_003881 [Marasmius tenuissimus]|uniref:Uncharacterized protein n=1 Tax=Marasmius tenuissimus TaxID=585030 RepID=A0ABR3A6B8_9AGAR
MHAFQQGETYDIPGPFGSGLGHDDTYIPPIHDQVPRRGVTVEDLPDEEVWLEIFPTEKEAGRKFGEGTTAFQQIRNEQILGGEEIYGPFENAAEWELAKWLIKNVGHNTTEEFLNLPIKICLRAMRQIEERVKPYFTTKDEFLKDIDALPGGIDWKYHTVRLEGDRTDEDGRQMTEELELWMRDPVECIRELIGNPAFRDKILPTGATVAPVILSSDKTKLSVFHGDKSAWPVYLTIGNIAKDVWRKVDTHATVLIGYLPVGKFDCYKDKTRPIAQYRTFHHCMSLLMGSLVEAGTKGISMICADGFLRWVFPILAAYVADYPEQCLVACCMENRCPICKVDPKERGSHVSSDLRTPTEALQLLESWQAGHHDEEFIKHGLRDIPDPFWAKLPHSNIFQAFNPDLDQLHKGMFKDHLVKWCSKIVGEEELDARFKSMTSHPDLWHFKNGISFVSQWTGAEHKAMQRIFLGLLAGAVSNDVIICVQAALDFIYYSSLHSHTDKTLTALSNALDTFHQHKDIFIELGAREATHFNIPKIHSMQHYPALIRHLGSADGFNTESPERLHIDYAKNAYRASNKKDYTIQMTQWLQRQESVDHFVVYLSWCKLGVYWVEGREARVRYIHHAGDHQAHRIQPSSSTTIRYEISATPSLSHVPASHIILQHRTQYFLEALESFLHTHGCRISPKHFDHFDLFKQITFALPKLFAAADSRLSLKNIVCASPPVPARDRKKATPAQMDFALMSTNERNENTDGTPLEGAYIMPRLAFDFNLISNLQVYVSLEFGFYSPFPLSLVSELSIRWPMWNGSRRSDAQILLPASSL